MEFKIDTKSSYTQITAASDTLDANLTAKISQKCKELTENGSQNFIIDLNSCVNSDNASFEPLVELHEYIYGIGQSLVFTGINENVTKSLKETETDQLLNIAPTLIEAIDIISMEILERDLLGEE